MKIKGDMSGEITLLKVLSYWNLNIKFTNNNCVFSLSLKYYHIGI